MIETNGPYPVTDTEPYRVARGGPRCWYIQEAVTGELKALPFRSRQMAQEAVDGWNERRHEFASRSGEQPPVHATPGNRDMGGRHQDEGGAG